MKRICISAVLPLMLLLFSGMVTKGLAQGKTDAVIMLDGERKELGWLKIAISFFIQNKINFMKTIRI